MEPHHIPKTESIDCCDITKQITKQHAERLLTWNTEAPGPEGQALNLRY